MAPPHYLGVRKRSSGKYTAEICCKYKREYLGMFKTAEEAARAYDAAAKRLRPNKTKINFPPEEEQPAGGGQDRNPSAASNPNDSHSLPSTSNSTTGSSSRRIVDVDLNGPPPPHYF